MIASTRDALSGSEDPCPILRRAIQLTKCGWYRGGNPCIEKSKKAGVAGRQVFETRVLSSCHLFALYAMADFSPPPLFSPTNTESDEANAGGVVIIHGEIYCPAVDLEIVPCHIHVCVLDPDPDTTTTASPSLPDQKPENRVQLKISLSGVCSFSDTFVYGRRISKRTSLRTPVQHIR